MFFSNSNFLLIFLAKKWREYGLFGLCLIFCAKYLKKICLTFEQKLLKFCLNFFLCMQRYLFPVYLILVNFHTVLHFYFQDTFETVLTISGQFKVCFCLTQDLRTNFEVIKTVLIVFADEIVSFFYYLLSFLYSFC